MMDTQPSLIDLFNEYFEVVPADTPEKRRECYRLRYQVYCKEGIIPGFDPKDYPDGLEYDEFDGHSVQCLLIHKLKKVTVGMVRIILNNQENRDKKLPLEIIAGDSLYPDFISLHGIQRTHLGEISRLILAPEFRARKGEINHPYGIVQSSDNSFQENQQLQPISRRKFPHPVLGLFVAVLRMSVEKNLIYWYSAMEPVCARFLRSFGIDFKPISPIMDYHGRRQSYIGYVPDMVESVYQTNQQVWALLTDNGKLFQRRR